ncbi:MAG UNVERIFIED_CONTAM: hypothetical protein LVR29_25420 [Microcystis novacekii LVE1205-3]
MAENQLYQAQVSEGASSSALQGDELARLEAARREANSRQAAARLEMEQLEKQFGRNQGTVGRCPLAINQRSLSLRRN